MTLACSQYAAYAGAATGYKPVSCKGTLEQSGTFGDYLCVNGIPYITLETGSSGCPVKQSEFGSIYKRNVNVWAGLIK